MFQHQFWSCPSFVDKSLKRSLREVSPQISFCCPPLFLKQSTELRLLKPKQPKVSVVSTIVLRASNSLKVFVIQPIHICVSVPRVARSTIHIASVHRPEIRNDVNVIFCDISGYIVIHELGIQERIHCSSYSNFTDTGNAAWHTDLVAERDSSCRLRRPPSAGWIVVEHSSISFWTAS